MTCFNNKKNGCWKTGALYMFVVVLAFIQPLKAQEETTTDTETGVQNNGRDIAAVSTAQAVKNVSTPVSPAQISVNATKPTGAAANTPAKQKMNEETAKAVNSIPGVALHPKTLETPAPEQPIKGFHPIKRAIQPVVELQKNSVQLQQQIMRLEGPIASLQPSMLGLKTQIVGVEGKLGKMDGHLGAVEGQVKSVNTQIQGVRHDIDAIREQINGLQGPIEQLHEPIVSVAQPLSGLKTQLAQVQGILATILLAILVASIAVAVGTPIAAVLVYRNRRKIFPDMKEKEMPEVKVQPTPDGESHNVTITPGS